MSQTKAQKKDKIKKTALLMVSVMAFALLSACGILNSPDYGQCADSSGRTEAGSPDSSLNATNGPLLECHFLREGNKEKVSNSEDDSQFATLAPVRINVDGSVLTSMVTDTGHKYQLNLHPGAGVELGNGLTLGLLDTNHAPEKKVVFGVSWGNGAWEPDSSSRPDSGVTKPLPKVKRWRCSIAGSSRFTVR